MFLQASILSQSTYTPCLGASYHLYYFYLPTYYNP